MKPILAIALLASACSTTTLRHGNRVGLGAAVISIACDWSSTRTAAGRGWSGQWERNPILGETPSVGMVDLYMATAIGATALAWLILPDKIGPFLTAPVIARQAITNSRNAQTVGGLCGISRGTVR